MNRKHLRLCIIILMIIGNLTWVVPESYEKIVSTCQLVSRFGLAYLAVESYLLSHNIKQYLTTFFSMSLIMFLGDVFMNVFVIDSHIRLNQYLFPAIFIGLIILYLIDIIEFEIKKHRIINTVLPIITALFLLALSVKLNHSLILILFMILTYTQFTKKTLYLSYVKYAALIFFIAFLGNQLGFYLVTRDEFVLVLLIPLLKLYNQRYEEEQVSSLVLTMSLYALSLWGVTIIATYLI